VEELKSAWRVGRLRGYPVTGNNDDYDVLADGAVVGRIFKANAAPVGSPPAYRLIILPLAQPSLASSSVGSAFPLGTAMDHMIKIELTPSEVTALKELAAAGPRGRKSRAVRRDLARLIRAHYVTEQSASMDTVVYVITDHGRRALAN
jgi:hypothetical protein